MIDAIGWILQQCVDAAIVAGLCRGHVLRSGARIEAVHYHPGGHVSLDWSEL